MHSSWLFYSSSSHIMSPIFLYSWRHTNGKYSSQPRKLYIFESDKLLRSKVFWRCFFIDDARQIIKEKFDDIRIELGQHHLMRASKRRSI